jgi:hypothetical protein
MATFEARLDNGTMLNDVHVTKLGILKYGEYGSFNLIPWWRVLEVVGTLSGQDDLYADYIEYFN